MAASKSTRKEAALKRSASRSAGRNMAKANDPVSTWLKQNASGFLKAVDNLNYEIAKTRRKQRGKGW